VVAAGVVVLCAPALARAYHWPLKPFDRQHVIRGSFDDPRYGLYFHFGVDIAAKDGTAVYAVESGTVFRYSDAVAVRRPGGREFSYWHVRALVPEHAYVQAGQEIGVVRPGFGHVHFAELDGHTYVNPLRRGALTPYRDTTTPLVGPIDVDMSSGKLRATVEAFDIPELRPSGAWRDAIFTPEVVRWRLLERGLAVVPWTTVANFSRFLEPDKYTSIYAPGTRQNRPNHPGRYLFWLTHGMSVGDGTYAIQVEASDTRGNTGAAAYEFDVSGDQILSTTKLASR